MKQLLAIATSLLLLTSCWPTSVSFKDTGSMPPEWKNFTLKTLENKAPTTPLSYAANLSESLKDGIMNNTRLLLIPDVSQASDSTLSIEGSINSYNITPLAIQDGDVAAQNRLTISASFTIYVTLPEEDEMTVTSTRFVDYDADTDVATIESTLLEDVNAQIIQDVINKLLSNW